MRFRLPPPSRFAGHPPYPFWPNGNFPLTGGIGPRKGGGIKRSITMRLDKWLKVSRLIKRRTVANEACDNARVMANGRAVKASYDVKVGDVLELKFGERTVKVEVLQVADNVGKADAVGMYKEIL